MKHLYLLIFLLISACAAAQTNTGGEISANTTWDLSGSPYIVSVDILVDQGVTLTINPGVVVKFDTGRSMLIRGTLRAIGNAADRITFTSNATNPKPGDWAYIEFDNESTPYDSVSNTGCQMSYCTVEYAGHYSSVYAEMAIGFYDTTPLIQHTTIQNCRGSAAKMNTDINLGYMLFRNNAIKNDSSEGGAELILLGPRQYYEETTSYIDFSNDTISNNSQSYPVDISALTIHFSNNVIAYNRGITFDFIAQNVNVSENKFTNNSATFQIGNGILLLYVDANQLKLKDNLFCRNLLSPGGFASMLEMLAPDSSDLSSLISNNVFAENQVYGQGDGLIYSEFSFENNCIAYNRIQNMPALVPNVTGNIDFNTMADNSYVPTSDISVIEGLDDYFTFHNNNFTGNKTSGPAQLYLFESTLPPTFPDLDATDNWWGTADSPTVASEIYDYFDNPSLAVVHYSPFLKQPDLNAPVSPPSNFTKTDLGNGSVQFSWVPNPESDIAGYRIYWDSLNCYSFAHSINVGKITSYTLASADYNTVYAITAYDNNSISGGLNDQFNGYESWFTYDQTFSPVTSVNQPAALNSGIKVYPNPFHSVAIIQFPKQELGIVEVRLFDLVGRQVWNEKAISPFQMKIPRSGLSSGMYFYQITNGGRLIASGKILAD